LVQPGEEGEVVQAARVILAGARTLFRAFLDPEIMAGWRTFDGVDLTFSALNARFGGGYCVGVRSHAGALSPALPATLNLAVEFAELVGEERIVEVIRVASDDPALAGSMTLTTTFEPDRDGTKVTFQARGAPAFVSTDVQAEILSTSLRKLALLTE
jgi:uncharacterized protein YndB with AHSA1/START domain